MTPYICQTPHHPPNSYGDCLRTVIQCLLDDRDVPHFSDGGRDDEGVKQLMREFLAEHDMQPFWMAIHGHASFAEVMQLIAMNNPDVYYLVNGRNANGESHVVICCGNEKVHDPAWIPTAMVGPVNDYWTVCLFVHSKTVRR